MSKNLQKDIKDITIRKRIEQCFVVPIIFCTLFVLPYFIYRQITHGLKSTVWPKAPGRVITSEVIETYVQDENNKEREPSSIAPPSSHPEEPKAFTADYRPIVIYEYWVQGNRFESDNLAYIQDGFGHHWARTKIQKYHPGKRVIVRYDPLDPTKAVLEAGAPGKGILTATLTFFSFEVLLIFLAAVFMWDIHRLNYLIIKKTLESQTVEERPRLAA